MNLESTYIPSQPSNDASREDEALVWLWERHEIQKASGWQNLQSELEKTFPDVAPSVLLRLLREFESLADFSVLTNGAVDASGPKTLDVQSFSHYQIQMDGEIPLVKRGGLASVHKAIDKRFHREVAIKLPLERFANDPEICARLEREGAISASLQHPNIVPVYEVGLYEPAGCPFVAMKFVEGATLLHYIGNPSAEFGQLRLIRAIREVCSALAHAHAHGVIHRDVKPENVMIGEFGEVHLLDWGFARSAQTNQEGSSCRKRLMDRFFQTATAGIFGTLAYMSPEQARGQMDLLSPKSDVFGIGGILCHLLTGRPTYKGSPKQMLQMAARCETSEALVALDQSGAAEELKSLVRDCVQADPDQRPTIREVGRWMDVWLESLEESRFLAERRSRRLSIALAVAGVSLVVLIAGQAIFRQYQRATMAETLDVAAVEAQALAGLNQASELHRWAMQQEREKQIEENLALLDESERLVDDSLQDAQPLSAMPVVADRAESLLQEIRNSRAVLESRWESFRQREVAAKRDARLLSQLGRAMDVDDRLLWECLTGVRLEIPADHRAHVFQQVFLENGWDWKTQTAQDIAEQFQRRPVEWQEEITGWLSVWAHDIEPLPKGDSLEQKIHEVQQQIDHHPLRSRLRSLDKTDLLSWIEDPQIFDSPVTAVLLGLRFHRAGQTEQAFAVLRKAALMYPDHRLVNATAGMCLAHDSATRQEALIYLHAWRGQEPQRGLRLVKLLMIESRELEAIDLCANIRKAGGQSAELAILEAVCQARRNRERESLALLNQSNELGPQMGVVRWGTPWVLIELNRIDEAEAALAIQLQNYPEEKLLSFIQGMIHVKSHRTEAARRVFQKAMDSMEMESDEKRQLLESLARKWKFKLD